MPRTVGCFGERGAGICKTGTAWVVVGKRSKQGRQQIQHGSAIRIPCVVARGAISKLHEATNYAPIRFGKERLKCVDSKANHIKAESARSLSGLN